MNTSNFTNSYKRLNPSQKKAVDTIEGPVLVIAGPGTGKTQVLTTRIANILDKTDTNPDSILALTFTDSGVKAMKERLVSIIGPTAYYVNIHTFHSFASDIIKANPDEFAFSYTLEPLADIERVSLFKNILDHGNFKAIKPFNAPYLYLSTLIKKIKDLKREGISPDDYKKILKQELQINEKDLAKNLEMQKVYEIYQSSLFKSGRYDYEDMINFVFNKFTDSPEFLSGYQERFQYFLVDEFQDTNTAQAKLLYLLNSYWQDNPNLFVVGDDDQSIYRFQGASIQNILDFTNRYPKAQKIVLDINYRSNSKIINLADSLISNNKLRISNQIKISKKQVAFKENEKDLTKSSVNFGEFSSSYSENIFISKTIDQLLKNGVEPRDIAIIYRNNSDSSDISDMLARFKIPYSIEGGENVLKSGIIVRLLYLISVIQNINTNQDLDLFTLLNYDFIQVSKLDVLKIARKSTKSKQNLLETILKKDYSKSEFDQIDKLEDFINKLIEWNQLSFNTTLINLVETVIEESNLLNWILLKENSYELLNKLNSFLNEIKRINSTEKNISLSKFLDYVELMNQNNISINEQSIDIDNNTVRLMTAHKSKGLEYDYVFIPKFIDGKWGNNKTRDLIKFPLGLVEQINNSSNSSLNEKQQASLEKLVQTEDERRLVFVSFTRAKKGIFLSYAKNYILDVSNKSGIPSMYYFELDKDLVTNTDIQKYETEATELLKRLIKPIDSNYLKTNTQEKDFLNSSLKDFTLSATSLNTYLECPYKFKLNFLFKTPEPKAKPLALGESIHKALEMGHHKLIKDGLVKYEYLENFFDESLQTQILTKNEYAEILEEGKSILKIYYDKYKEYFNQKPTNKIMMETYLGWGFSKPILDGQILLQGKIDKIEVTNQKEREIKITDYKTGKPQTRNEILGKTINSRGDLYRQLMFYKLLIDLDKKYNFKVSEVELDFIGARNQSPKKESFIITDKDIDNLKKIVREAHSKILELKFERTTDYKNCHSCKFRNHCWPDRIPVSSDQLVLEI